MKDLVIAVISAAAGAALTVLGTWMLSLRRRREDNRVKQLARRMKRFCEHVQEPTATETIRFTIDRFIAAGVVDDDEWALAEKAALHLCQLGVLEYQSGGYYLTGHRPTIGGIPGVPGGNL